MTTVSSVSSIQPLSVIYDLNALFDAAVADQGKRADDYAQQTGSAYGQSMTAALLNRATKVVDALKAFKDAGVEQVQTAHALDTGILNYRPEADLCTQIERGQVQAVPLRSL